MARNIWSGSRPLYIDFFNFLYIQKYSYFKYDNKTLKFYNYNKLFIHITKKIFENLEKTF